jgi:hypothetical protein
MMSLVPRASERTICTLFSSELSSASFASMEERDEASTAQPAEPEKNSVNASIIGNFLIF